MPLIESAKLGWQNNVPVSEMFADPYFSLKNGEAETDYVFLQHNNLPGAFLNRSSFVIGETGFGTGLNFFVTAKSWQRSQIQQVQKRAHLYYYSIEKYPIDKRQLAGILKNWPQFDDFSPVLLAQYPGNCPGFHQINFPDQNITLVLMIGDVCAMLEQLLVEMDAWYLDGFSPSKNPDMWSQAVFEKISKSSKVGATFATFAAAGFVRRNLQSAGFKVTKVPGFGKKREMLCGTIDRPGIDRPGIDRPGIDKPTTRKTLPPWYSVPENKITASDVKSPRPVAIIGGGISGLSVALAFADKNIESVLFDSGASVGTGASGNPAGIVLPRISSDLDSASQFYISAFYYAVNYFQRLKQQHPELFWKQNGVLQFIPEKKLKKTADLFLPESLVSMVDAARASTIAGLNITSSALYYPRAGTINPKQLCEIMQIAAGDFLQTRFNSSVHSLEKDGDFWVLKTNENRELCRAENVVIASGFDASRLLDTNIYTVESSRGQLSYLSASENSLTLNVSVCGEGYVIPARNNTYVVGATYGGCSADLSADDHDLNWQNANNLLPENLASRKKITGGRVSFRATTKDHLPVVGPVIDEFFYKKNYADLRDGKPQQNYPDAAYRKGLYLTIGHGSRGLVSCVNSSKYLVDLICGAVITESADRVALLHPGRFLIRQLKKS